MSFLLQMQWIPPSTSINCQADKSFTHKLWHLLAVCFCMASTTYNGTVQLAAQAGTLLFHWKRWVWLFWQNRLPYHLIVLKATVLTSPESLSSCCSPRRDAVRLGSHHSLHTHAAQRSLLEPWPHHLALKGRIQLHEAAAAVLWGFTDSAHQREGVVHHMSYSRWLPQKHCRWKN